MRVLVAGWIGSTNLGDELVFAGVRHLLDRRGDDVAAISIDPVATRRTHGVGAVDAHDPLALHRAVAEADLVVFGGGGLLQDISSPYNLPYHLSRVLLARAKRTPVVGIGLGVGEVQTRIGRLQVARATNAMAAVAVRDQASADLLVELGGRQPVVAADAALLLNPASVAVEDRLVVALRPWAGSRSRRPASGRGDTTPRAQVEALAAGIDAASRRLDLPVHFVALQADRDDPFHRRVAAAMQRPASFATPSFAEVMAEIATGRAVVAMRYHAAISALIAGRPSVQLAYSGKLAALAHVLGPAGRALALRPADLAQLPQALLAVQQHQGALAGHLARLRARAQRNELALPGDHRR